MKSLQESLLDNDDKLFDDTNIESNIEKFLRENYRAQSPNDNQSLKFTIYKEKGEYYVDVDCAVLFFVGKGKHLTNGTFKFGTVGDFSKSSYDWSSRGLQIQSKRLEDLVGAPREILGDLDCSYCRGLKSLKGCPEYVERYILLDHCDSLSDIKDLKNLKHASMIRGVKGSNFVESDFRKYVSEKVCDAVYGSNYE